MAFTLTQLEDLAQRKRDYINKLEGWKAELEVRVKEPISLTVEDAKWRELYDSNTKMFQEDVLKYEHKIGRQREELSDLEQRIAQARESERKRVRTTPTRPLDSYFYMGTTGVVEQYLGKKLIAFSSEAERRAFLQDGWGLLYDRIDFKKCRESYELSQWNLAAANPGKITTDYGIAYEPLNDKRTA